MKLKYFKVEQVQGRTNFSYIRRYKIGPVLLMGRKEARWWRFFINPTGQEGYSYDFRTADKRFSQGELIEGAWAAIAKSSYVKKRIFNEIFQQPKRR
jgi:hypothetical protein